MLRVNDIHASYGPILALHGVSLEVADGSIVTLLGPNGAGKSTTLRTISGLMHPTSGTIEFDGRRIDRFAAEKVVSLGISHVPENRQLFAELTVLENLRLGSWGRRDRNGIKDDMDQVFTYFPILLQRQKQVAGTLSGGEQQMLAIGRGLMARPRLLILDEPSLGLAPLVTREIFQIIKSINQKQKVTILLVEQNANLALEIAQQGYVLETGRVVLADSSVNLQRSESVRQSYLGY
jgi:branched-chain amino acid transport system ATP-binding protein